MKHFLLTDFIIKEETKELIDYAVNTHSWSSYGRGRFKLYIGLLPNRELILPLAKKFKNPKELFFKMELNKVGKMGVVMPHTDHHRYVTINVPLKGDFKNSYLDFYKPSTGVPACALNNNEEHRGGGMFYPESELDYQISYNVPICFNTQEIHGVTNTSLEDRYILTMSFKETWTFEKIYDMYTSGKLLV